MNVIVIEDTASIRTLISQTLRSYGYIPHELTSKKNIQSLLKTMPINIVVMSTSLLHTNSKKLCQFIREMFPKSLILTIHSRGPWSDKVDILQSGADDCLSFPFPAQELLARIQSLLRRPHTTCSDTLSCGKISLNPLRKEVSYGKSPINLTRKEFQVLEYLLRNQERTITRAELLDNVWDFKRIINSNTVDVHVQKIRKKLKNMRGKTSKRDSTGTLSSDSKKGNDTKKSYLQDGSISIRPSEIQTVHGVGYRMEGNIDSYKKSEDITQPPSEL